MSAIRWICSERVLSAWLRVSMAELGMMLIVVITALG